MRFDLVIEFDLLFAKKLLAKTLLTLTFLRLLCDFVNTANVGDISHVSYIQMKVF